MERETQLKTELRTVTPRERYQALIARAFDGAIVVDGQRVVAHKSGMHVIRGGAVRSQPPRDVAPPCDRDNDWSDV